MGSINTKSEFIFTISKEDFGSLKSFLESLDLRHGNEEILDHWFSEGVWNLSTEEGEEFIIVFGKEKIHIFFKKIRILNH